MTGARIGIGDRRGIACALLALALLLRLVVPAGWMPAAGGGYAITLCTGAGVSRAWVDAEGKVHKGEPGKAAPDHQCVFAGFSAALDAPPLAGALLAPLAAVEALPPLARSAVAIGRGLAAPPPPATGPPASL
jgi:hypothetical protein